MLFAFFLGAGNIIFPPLAGQLAGENLMPAMFGFLLTAVGLPLITIVAIAVAGGSWDHLTQDLPKKSGSSYGCTDFHHHWSCVCSASYWPSGLRDGGETFLP